jgi:predicted transcriptional regulator
MACINSDGTLSPSARSLLTVLERPLTPEEIAENMKRPIFLVRSSLREMSEAQLVVPEGDAYVRTTEGTQALNRQTA